MILMKKLQTGNNPTPQIDPRSENESQYTDGKEASLLWQLQYNGVDPAERNNFGSKING